MYQPWVSVIMFKNLHCVWCISPIFFEVGNPNASWDGGVSHTVPFSGHCDLDL